MLDASSLICSMRGKLFFQSSGWEVRRRPREKLQNMEICLSLSAKHSRKFLILVFGHALHRGGAHFSVRTDLGKDIHILLYKDPQRTILVGMKSSQSQLFIRTKIAFVRAPNNAILLISVFKSCRAVEKPVVSCLVGLLGNFGLSCF